MPMSKNHESTTSDETNHHLGSNNSISRNLTHEPSSGNIRSTQLQLAENSEDFKAISSSRTCSAIKDV